jgi:hypothetical protein
VKLFKVWSFFCLLLVGGVFWFALFARNGPFAGEWVGIRASATLLGIWLVALLWSGVPLAYTLLPGVDR